MNAFIISVGNWQKSHKTSGNCCLVIFKDLETSNEYKMWVDDSIHISARFIPHLQLGVIFNDLCLINGGEDYIDSRSNCSLGGKIKTKAEKEAMKKVPENLKLF